jgi:hypothetical protein
VTDCPRSFKVSPDYPLNRTKTISGFSHLMNNSVTIHIGRQSFDTMKGNDVVYEDRMVTVRVRENDS